MRQDAWVNEIGEGLTEVRVKVSQPAVEHTVLVLKPPNGFHPAAYPAQFFDTIEINSSFYRPPAALSVRGWVQRVAGNPRFKFTAKLFRGFTHAGNATREDEGAVKES